MLPRFSDECRVYHRSLHADAARALDAVLSAPTDEGKAVASRWHESALRQIRNGECDGCARLRLTAALDYIRAADLVRMLRSIGVQGTTPGGHGHPAFERLKDLAAEYEKHAGPRIPAGDPRRYRTPGEQEG